MLSKEEIEKDIKILKNISKCFTYSMWSEDTEALRRVLQYIKQLESELEMYKDMKNIMNSKIGNMRVLTNKDIDKKVNERNKKANREVRRKNTISRKMLSRFN